MNKYFARNSRVEVDGVLREDAGSKGGEHGERDTRVGNV